MIVNPAQIQLIIDGTKTQQRQRVKPYETARDSLFRIARKHARIYTLASRNNVKHQVGTDYAIQIANNKPGVWWDGSTWHQERLGDHWQPLRVTLTAIYLQPLHAVSREDAKKEGYAQLADFLRDWESHNEMWVLEWNGLVYNKNQTPN